VGLLKFSMGGSLHDYLLIVACPHLVIKRFKLWVDSYGKCHARHHEVATDHNTVGGFLLLAAFEEGILQLHGIARRQTFHFQTGWQSKVHFIDFTRRVPKINRVRSFRGRKYWLVVDLKNVGRDEPAPPCRHCQRAADVELSYKV